MIWTAVLLTLLTFLLVKLFKLVTYWNDKGIPHESFLKAYHHNFWKYSTQNPFGVIDGAVRKNGRTFGSFRAFTPVLMVSDVGAVKEILNRQFTNFYRRTTDIPLRDRLWDSLVSILPYDHWKPVRTLLGQCLTASKLKGMIPKFDRMAKRGVSQLESIAHSKENEISFIKAYGMDSVVASAFGVDLESNENPDSPFIKNASDLFNPSFGSYLFMLAPKLLKYCPFADFPPKKSSEFFEEFGRHVIDEKKKYLDQVIKDGTADIMDNFLIAQREDPNSAITDDVLIGQAYLFYLAGVDTTVVSTEMVTFFLTIHPEVQEKVVEEIRQVMGSREQVEYDDILKMKYLEAAIQESLRHYPLVFMVDRVCNKDTTVPGIPCVIEEGTIVEIPVRFIHFDPELFPEPEKFMPERFLKKNSQDGSLQSYLTFGGGPKNCVGRRLAIMNMQVLLVNMLRRVKLEVCESTPKRLKLKDGANFTNVTEKPLVLKIVPRVWTSELRSG